MPKKKPVPVVSPAVGEKRNRAIDFARAKIPTGELYNIFGETIDVHSSDIGDRLVTVAEVKVRLWSMQDVS